MEQVADISTADSLQYIYRPILRGALQFDVRASNDAHIALTSANREIEPMYEILLGGWDNTASVIRYNRQKPDKVRVDTPGLLTNNNYSRFLIEWNNGLITVKRNGSVLMQWQDPSPFAISHYGVRTAWGAQGQWKIHHGTSPDADISTADSMQYIFSPIPTGELQFDLRASNDAHIILTSANRETQPMYEIKLGCWKNTESVIEYNHQEPFKVRVDTPGILTNNNYRRFLIEWHNGRITVKSNGSVIMQWEDPNPFGISHYGVRTAWGSQGQWRIHNSTSTGADISTADKLQYIFRPILMGALQFEVCASSNAHIALTSANRETEPMYEILLGGWENTASVIRYNRQQPDKVRVDTPGLLTNNNYSRFLIEWNNGLITVQRNGSELMQWQDPSPFAISHYGVRTAWGSQGQWRIHHGTSKGADISTKDSMQYIFRPMPTGEFLFDVRASNDVHIALTSANHETQPMYEVKFGCWGNTASVIQYNRQDAVKVRVETPGILSNDKYRRFLIEWNNGHITAKRNCTLLMQWHDPNPFGISHYGVRTAWGSQGQWRIHNSTSTGADISTADSMQYVFRPMPSGKLQFDVRASNDVNIALTSANHETEPMYEIKLGCWKNTASVIEYNRQEPFKVRVDTPGLLNKNNHVGFLIEWHNGHITLKRNGSVLMQWQDPRPFGISHYGVRTAWGSQGQWKIHHGTSPGADIATADILQYIFRPIPTGALEFDVRASSNAHIALTSGSHETQPMYEILLGGWDNTASVIRYNRQKPDKVRVDTPGLLTNNNYRRFLIEWNNGHITVKRNGAVLMEWQDPKPFSISHYGVRTAWGAQGQWKIHHST